MSRTVKYELKHPITLKLQGSGGKREEKVTTITLELPDRLKAKHLRATDGAAGDVGKTLALLASFSGQPIKVIDELDAVDLAALAGELEGFL